ncbi:MAG: T9SS type A sorting domain-containing protein [Ferruginibacter sp.]
MKNISLGDCQPVNRVKCIVKHFSVLVFFILSARQVSSQAPAITTFTPTSAAKGNTVTITGTNFTGATDVSFGGTPASSFVVNSSTNITAIVPQGTSGSVTVTNAGGTGSKVGFYYLPLSGIITDYAGYWSTTTANNNAILPDNSHNLLAFTYNGTTYSTGVNNSLLTGQGINYTPGNFKALPVANIAGSNTGGSIYLSMGTKKDGNVSVANASAFSGITVRDVMTDGVNGLDLGTGITNLPTTAIMTFDIHLIHLAKIIDDEPDIIITQIAQPSSGNDVFQFVDASGATVGNTITQNMTLLTKLGSYNVDLFNLSPSAPFNSAICFSAFSIDVKEIRLVGFKLSDFGINASNYTQVASLKVTPSGNSDYAFIAYSDALEMSPNIAQNVERSNSSICAGGTANLEVIASASYGGTLSYMWQESTDGGSTWAAVTDGGSYSGATTNRLSIVAATNTYKYKCTVTESGTGFSATCSPFTIAVITPTPPTAVSITASATTCLNNLVSIAGTVTGGSNLFYQWQTNASGSYVNIPGAILKNYLPPVNATNIISYRLLVSSGSGCSGGLTSTAATITVVGISSVTPASRCGTGVVSMSATATSGTISWYAASTGGSILATGTSYAPSISASATYYVSTDATQCASANRVPVTATINTITWAGTNTTDWSLLANWDCGGVPPDALPTSTSNVTIPTTPTGGRYPTISTTAPIKNIAISPSASIIVANGGVFEIYGTITNNGTFTATDGAISMRGAVQQTIPANAFSTNTIKNLTINNSAGVLLGGALNITGTYTPTAGALTTFGYLTLKSDSNGTARVAQGSGTYVIGNVNVERYMPSRRAWRLMTSPLTNSNTIYQSWQNGGVYTPGKGTLVTAPGGGSGIDEAGNSSLKTWHIPSQALRAVGNTNIPISPGSNGGADNIGYFIFVRGDREYPNIDHNGIRTNITTLLATGYLQTGTQTYSGLSATAGGFSLIGNPYASPIDWKLVLANTGTSNIKRKFYVWDPGMNSVGGYVAMDDVVTPGVFVPTPATSSQNNFIQSSQALFVITNTAGATTVEIKETNKASTNNTVIFGRPVGTVQSLITDLYLFNPADQSTIIADGTRADFDASFSSGIDDDDNIKFSNVNETFGFMRNNVFLATERRQLIIKRDTLFFRLNKAVQRSYQFQFKPGNFSDPSLVAMLEDSYTGIPTLLSLTGITKVNFVINSNTRSQAIDRFRVVFTQSSTLPVLFSSIKAYQQRKDIAVNWKVENEDKIQYYEVERSADGSNFIKKTSVEAKQNNNSAYTWVDENTNAGDNFYRIKSIGPNGAVLYSQVVKVKIVASGNSTQVYPNPVTGDNMSIQLVNQPKGIYNISVTNSIGQVVLKEQIDHNGGSATQTINVPASLKTGSYQVEISCGDNIKNVMKVLIR